MIELADPHETVRNMVILGQKARVFQRVTPDSSTVFLVAGLPSGFRVEIGGAEEVASFFLDENRQQFVPWKDSGKKDTQYLRLADLPPMTRMLLSSVSEG